MLSSSERGDHAELVGLAAALEAILGLGQGAVPLEDAPRLAVGGRPIASQRLSRACPDGAKKHVGGGAEWAAVVRAVRAQRAEPSSAAQPAIFRVCGDLRDVRIAGAPSKSAKYFFGSTGSWWRARMAAAARAAPAAHATPLFAAVEAAADTWTADAGGAAPAMPATPAAGEEGQGAAAAAALSGRVLHVAVHIRRGDMVYRNFATQLSPDAYYIHAMWHVLALVQAGAGARRVGVQAAHASAGSATSPRPVAFHVFTQLPPAHSWTGQPQVPLEGRGAPYVDELGCAASLHEQLAQLASADGSAAGLAALSWPQWTLRMHLQADPVASLLHMAKADVLIASDSSFSLAAAVLSSGLVLSRAGWKRFPSGARQGMLHSLELDADGGFEPAEAMARWARWASTTT